MKTLKQKTMRSIRTVYVLQRVFHPIVLKMGVLAVLLWQLGAQVYVAKVFENSPAEVLAMVQYMFTAFLKTEVVVQVVTVGIVAVVIWMLTDMVRMLTHARSHIHA